MLVRLTGWSASNAVHRNQPGQETDSKVLVRPLFERMKVKRLSCSLFLPRSVMSTSWKRTEGQVSAEGLGHARLSVCNRQWPFRKS